MRPARPRQKRPTNNCFSISHAASVAWLFYSHLRDIAHLYTHKIASEIANFSRYNADVTGGRFISLLLLLTCPVFVRAQEVKILDISDVQQRITLRYPPAPPPECGEKGKSCVGSGSAGVSIADGAPDYRDPQALAVYLLSVSPTEIDPTQPFEAEFRVLNTGIVPLEIPVFPHLSDLQPSDESAIFSYFSLALVVRVDTPPQQAGFVELYGASDHEGTILVLKPGEWIRVRAKIKLQNWPRLPSTRMRGEFWLRRNTFQPHPGGGFTSIENLYPNSTPTPWINIRINSRNIPKSHN